MNRSRNARHLRLLLCLLLLSLAASVALHAWLRVTTTFQEDVQSGDVNRVRAWLDKNASLVNRPDAFGAAPLHYAALWGHPDVAQLLIERGADVNAFASDGKTPLHIAAACGHDKVTALLLAHGADMHAEDFRGRTPLHSVVSVGFKFVPNIEIARQLLDRGAQIDAIDCDEWTPLHWATSRDHAEIESWLIERGATVDLHIAASRGDIARVWDFLEARPDLLNAGDATGLTPLHCAAAKGRADVVSLLLDLGAEVDPGGNKEGWTPLRKAALHGHTEVAALLIRRGANVNALNPEGQSILQVALLEGRTEVARVLREGGAK